MVLTPRIHSKSPHQSLVLFKSTVQNNIPDKSLPLAKSMAATQSNALAELFTAILQNRQNNYSNAAALTVLVYDIFLTLGKEVTYIWGSRWSIPKTLYLFGRYYGVCYLSVLLAVGTNGNLTVELSCLLLVLRLRGFSPVYFYGQCDLRSSDPRFIFSRKKRVVLDLLWKGELLITTVALKRTSQHASVNPPGIPLPGCLSVRNTDFALVGWVPTLTVSACFFLLTVAKLSALLQDPDGKFRFSRLKEHQYVSPLISAFFLDGTFFFLLTFGIVLACAIIDLTVKGALAPAGTPWLIAAYSFSATRLILNMREVSARDMTIDSIPEVSSPIAFSSDNRRIRDRAGRLDSYTTYFGE
ncbi:hypothetical protein C8F04DRAFT_225840 [Mycena alexandri]|uniref:DUF6533 domain-containing protein n=1 Tax=Mycena alexandri TaxID=1745969 RepID=A0AAD6TB80_9AGAR|nr:hypothetical protein C8F04DRAFT_225840 [Mycena alexandri]